MPNLNLIGLCAAIMTLIAFKVAFHIARPQSVTKRILWCVVLGAFGTPSVLFAAYYLKILPEWAWFYEMRSWRGSEFLVVSLGASAGILASLLPRMALVAILIPTFAISTIPYLKQLIAPLDARQISSRWENKACLQTTSSTCGPASIATILGNFGVETTEKEVALHAFTCNGGTEAWYLARYARNRGLKAHFDFRPGLPADLQLPALVGVRIGHAGHFIPVLTRKDNLVTIADPLFGLETIELKDLNRRYQLTGFHLSVSQE